MKLKSELLLLVEELIKVLLNIKLEKLKGKEIFSLLKFLIETQSFLNKKIIAKEEFTTIGNLPKSPIKKLTLINDLISKISKKKTGIIIEEEKLIILKLLMSLQEFINKIILEYETLISSRINPVEATTKNLKKKIQQFEDESKKISPSKNYSLEKLIELHTNIVNIQGIVHRILADIQLLTPFGVVANRQTAPIPGIELTRLTTPIYEINQEFNYYSEINNFLSTQHAPFAQLVEFEEKSNKSPLISRLEASAIVMKNLFINNNNINMGYYQAATRVIDDLHIQLLPSQDLITPVANSFYDETHDMLLINAVAFVNSELNIKYFNINYNYTLGALGDPQLDIYIVYDAPELSAIKYNANPFMIGFWSNSVVSQNGSIVQLKQIKSVNVFLVNQDPRTSRGTTTTVQNQTSGSTN